MESMIENFHNVEIMLGDLQHYGKYAKKNFHNVETVVTKLPQCGNYIDKTSTMWRAGLQKRMHLPNTRLCVINLPTRFLGRN